MCVLQLWLVNTLPFVCNSLLCVTPPLFTQPWLVNTLPFVCNAVGTVLSVRLAEWLQRRQLSLTAVRQAVEVGSQMMVGVALFSLREWRGVGGKERGWYGGRGDVVAMLRRFMITLCRFVGLRALIV